MEEYGLSFNIDKLYNHKLSKKYGVNNMPTKVHLKRLNDLIVNILDPIINISGENIKVFIGYIGSELNDAIKDNIPKNLYTDGYGVSIYASDMELVYNIASQLEFNEIIYDTKSNTIYISYIKGNNNRKITKK